MHTLIHFRDWGCQGVRDIVSQALDFATREENQVPTFEGRLVFYSKKLNDAKNQIELWKEVAELFAVTFECVDDLHKVDKAQIISGKLEKLILIIDDELIESEKEEIENIISDNALIAQSLGDDVMSSNALAMFTNIVFTALRSGKNITKLSTAFIGDAGSKNCEYANSLLNASMCLRHELGISFADNKAMENECTPQKDHLDIAMQSGSKVFLTYDPNFLPDNPDLLYINNWSYQQQGNFTSPAHPYTYDAIKSKFGENTQVISLIPEVESSAYDTKLYKRATVFTRMAALLYFQNSLAK